MEEGFCVNKGRQYLYFPWNYIQEMNQVEGMAFYDAHKHYWRPLIHFISSIGFRLSNPGGAIKLGFTQWVIPMMIDGEETFYGAK